MNVYEKPTLEIILIANENIIATSTTSTDQSSGDNEIGWQP